MVLATWWQDGPAWTCHRSRQKSGPGELRPARNASSSARPIACARSPNDFLTPAPSPEGQEINRRSNRAKLVLATFSLSFIVNIISHKCSVCSILNSHFLQVAATYLRLHFFFSQLDEGHSRKVHGICRRMGQNFIVHNDNKDS